MDAFSSLNCEVVFHPSFGSPRVTQFALHVDGGNKQKLLCEAQVRESGVKFYDYLKILYYSIEVNRNLTPFKSVILRCVTVFSAELIFILSLDNRYNMSVQFL